jgi:cytochrome c-type biogenesis protein CcmH/NrfG
VSQSTESDVASSVTQIQAALKRDPGNPRRYIQLGQAYCDENDYQRAFEAFQQAVKVAPASAEAHNWLGAFLMGRGNLLDAIFELRKAVSLDPTYARAYTNLGSALAKSGDLSDAVAAFRKSPVASAEQLGSTSWSPDKDAQSQMLGKRLLGAAPIYDGISRSSSRNERETP